MSTRSPRQTNRCSPEKTLFHWPTYYHPHTSQPSIHTRTQLPLDSPAVLLPLLAILLGKIRFLRRNRIRREVPQVHRNWKQRKQRAARGKPIRRTVHDIHAEIRMSNHTPRASGAQLALILRLVFESFALQFDSQFDMGRDEVYR
jgi:hypothetical protein